MSPESLAARRAPEAWRRADRIAELLATAREEPLATAVAAGADRFLTSNRKDFPQTIAEIQIVYPDELTEDA